MFFYIEFAVYDFQCPFHHMKHLKWSQMLIFSFVLFLFPCVCLQQPNDAKVGWTPLSTTLMVCGSLSHLLQQGQPIIYFYQPSFSWPYLYLESQRSSNRSLAYINQKTTENTYLTKNAGQIASLIVNFFCSFQSYQYICTTQCCPSAPTLPGSASTRLPR